VADGVKELVMPDPAWFHPIDYTDVQALRKFTPSQRWTYIELFSGELGSKHGLVEVRSALIAGELDCERAIIDFDIAALDAGGAIIWDAANRLAYQLGHLLRHCPNDSARDAWRKAIRNLPQGCATNAALSELDGTPCPHRGSTVVAPFARVEQEQEQEQEQERKTGTGTSTGTGSPSAPAPAPAAPEQLILEAGEAKGRDKTPPPLPPKTRKDRCTIAQATEYANELKMPTGTGEKFVNHYDSIGWKRGKAAILDWRATMRTWRNNENNSGDRYRGKVDNRAPVREIEGENEVFF